MSNGIARCYPLMVGGKNQLQLETGYNGCKTPRLTTRSTGKPLANARGRTGPFTFGVNRSHFDPWPVQYPGLPSVRRTMSDDGRHVSKGCQRATRYRIHDPVRSGGRESKLKEKAPCGSHGIRPTASAVGLSMIGRRQMHRPDVFFPMALRVFRV